MNNDLKPAVKKALILGAVGAVFLPLMYEAYANISHSFSFMLLICWAAASGAVLSGQKVKNALVAIVSLLAITYGGALVVYMILHPATKSFLSSVAKYYELDIYDNVFYWAVALGITLLVFVVYFILYLVRRVAARQKSHGEKLRNDIDNAFND